jgi:type I restriction enzyme S subunit
MIDGPYKLPKGWRWVRLGEVCEIWDSLRKPVKKKDRRPGDVPYCGANGIIDYVEGYTHVGEFVLLAEDGGFYGPGEPSAYMMSGRFWANNHVHILCGKSDHLTNKFLYYWLIACDLRSFLTGATRPKLTQSAMKSIPIPLPPLEEQKRIVARVEELMSRIKEVKKLREETKKQTELLWQSVLAETFPQPGTQLPKGWRWVRLREITKVLESGKRPKGGVKNIANGIPSIGGEHITWDGGFDFANIRYVPYEFYQSMRKGKINKGDILIVKDGATTGKTAYVSEDFPFKDACINEHVYILRIYENLAISQFVFLFLMSSSGQTQLKNTFHGAAQGGINSEFINQVTIPLPPLEEQKRIANYLQEVHEKIKELKEVQTKTEEEIKLLEQSILEKAFRGEL